MFKIMRKSGYRDVSKIMGKVNWFCPPPKKKILTLKLTAAICSLKENLDLLDGLRVLTRLGPHFYPGRERAIEPPFIFALSLDSERGNKPHIYAKEEILQKVIIEVRN